MSSSRNSFTASDSSTLQYDQESFETFRFKVVQLCIDIGLGTPSEVEPMAGGSFNRVIGLAFSTTSTSRYVLRIPRYTVEIQDIKDQVAVLLYLSAHLPVAKVAAYDCTVQNNIQAQYVLQERLPGRPIEAIDEDLSLEERLQIASALADLFQSIHSVILPRSGRLVQSTPMPEVSHEVSQVSDVDIGIKGYRLDASQDMPITDEQDLSSLLKVLCETRSEVDDYDRELQSYWRQMRKIIAEMGSIGLLSDQKVEMTLCHWDFSPQNVLVDKVGSLWTVSGIVDWDDVISVPAVIGRKPPVWLWLPKVRVDLADIYEPAALTCDQDLIKRRYEEVISASIPSFLDDAYYRGRWLRRITTFALHGFTYSEDVERFKALIQDWNKYFQESGFVSSSVT